MCAYSTGQNIQIMNRPLLQEDLDSLHNSVHGMAIRSLVERYRQQALPVMNGGFNYSNFVEGPSQSMTCLPYRLWEYGSLFAVLEDGFLKNDLRFLDVGGAASPLVYYLAEQGCQGVTVDLQPLLVDITNYVAAVRSLSLKALVRDITTDAGWESEFDLVVFISVLEHIDVDSRATALRSMFRALKPGGFLYMTFDYGSYVDNRTSYLKHRNDTGMVSGSISDIEALCSTIQQMGFHFVGNDPRSLGPDVLGLTTSPASERIVWQRSLNLTIDGETPWRELAKYFVKRLFRYTGAKGSRFTQHNFFRMYLQKPEIDV